MKAAEGKVGRVFVLRLEDGDRIPDCIEAFAAARGIRGAFCALVGGIGGGRLVVGPHSADALPVTPLVHELLGVHEIAAVGTIFPSEDGSPRLHMHGALGREGWTRTGCVRPGLDVWKLGEVVLLEILGADLVRRRDPATGFEVLEPVDEGAGSE